MEALADSDAAANLLTLPDTATELEVVSDADAKFLALAEADSVADAESEAEAFLFTNPVAAKEPLHDAAAEANLVTLASEDTAPVADKLAAPDIVCAGNVPSAVNVALAVNVAAAVITFPLEENGIDENGAPEKLICLLLYVVGC